MKPRRPMPEDFARTAKRMDRGQLAAHYTAHEATIRRWIQEAGFEVRRKNSRPVPRDFRERAAELTITALCKNYGATAPTVRGWALSAGVTIQPGKRFIALPAPEGFADYARSMTMRQLQAREGVGREVILRWRRESGLPEEDPPPHMVPMPDDFVEAAPTLYKIEASRRWLVSQRVLHHWAREAGVHFRASAQANSASGFRHGSPTLGMGGRCDVRLDTLANRAADTLRRNRWQVSPCNRDGHYDPRGPMWRVGRVIVDEDEMIRRAARYEPSTIGR